MPEESKTSGLVELTRHMFDAPAEPLSVSAGVDGFTLMVHVFVWEQDAITHVVSSGDTAAARAAAERLAHERG